MLTDTASCDIINLTNEREVIHMKYKFEWQDLRCFVTVVNVILIMVYGLSIAWFGLIVAIVGIIRDFTTDRKINSIVMHTANVVLNMYFLALTIF